MRVEIGFGLGFDRSGKPISQVERNEAIKLILTEACLVFGGANITFGQGAWLDGSGNLVVEESATLVTQHPATAGRMTTEVQEEAKQLADYIVRILNQQAVIITLGVATSSYHYHRALTV